MPKWKNFEEKEIVNPLFDDCPASSWNELDKKIAGNLLKTVGLLQIIRNFYTDYYGKYYEKSKAEKLAQIQVNSSFRLHDRKGSAHQLGHAIDWQLVHPDINWIHYLFSYMRDKSAHSLILDTLHISGFRCFWEWKGKKNYGWCHTDTDYMISNSAPDFRKNLRSKTIRLMVGYPLNNDMVYEEYDGISPWQKAGIDDPMK